MPLLWQWNLQLYCCLLDNPRRPAVHLQSSLLVAAVQRQQRMRQLRLQVLMQQQLLLCWGFQLCSKRSWGTTGSTLKQSAVLLLKLLCGFCQLLPSWRVCSAIVDISLTVTASTSVTATVG